MNNLNFGFIHTNIVFKKIIISIILCLFFHSPWLFALPKMALLASLSLLLGQVSTDTIHLAAAPDNHHLCENSQSFIPSNFLTRQGFCKPGAFFEATQDYKKPPEDQGLPRKIYAKDVDKIDNSIEYLLITNPDSSSNERVIGLLYDYGYEIKIEEINGSTSQQEIRKIRQKNKNQRFLGKFVPAPKHEDKGVLSAWYNSWKSDESRYQPEISPEKIESCSLHDLLLRPKFVHKLGGNRQAPWNVNQAIGNCAPSVYGRAIYLKSGEDNDCSITEKGNVVELYKKGKDVRAVVFTDAVGTAAGCRKQRTAKHKKGRSRR